MKIAGKYYFRADQHTVWNTFMNPDAVAKALPGVDRLVPIEGETDAWRATAKIGIASVSGSYTGIVRMSDVVPPDHFWLGVGGEGQGSIIGGNALLNLSYDTEKNKTLVSWTADANLYGRLAGVGQRLVGAAARMLARQFLRSLARQLPRVDAQMLLLAGEVEEEEEEEEEEAEEIEEEEVMEREQEHTAYTPIVPPD